MVGEGPEHKALCGHRRARPGLPTHLAAPNAHATVVEPEFVKGEAGWAPEQGLESSHSIRPKCVVTEVEFHQLCSCSDEALPEGDLDIERAQSVSQTTTRCHSWARPGLSTDHIQVSGNVAKTLAQKFYLTVIIIISIIVFESTQTCTKMHV